MIETILQMDLNQFLDSFYVTVTVIVGVLTGIGMISRSLTIGIYIGYLGFAYIALETADTLLTNILYTTLVLVFIGFGFKFWRMEAGGEA